MQEVLSYILILGLIVLPGFLLIFAGIEVLQVLYFNQSLVIAMPFP